MLCLFQNTMNSDLFYEIGSLLIRWSEQLCKDHKMWIYFSCFFDQESCNIDLGAV